MKVSRTLGSKLNRSRQPRRYDRPEYTRSPRWALLTRRVDRLVGSWGLGQSPNRQVHQSGSLGYWAWPGSRLGSTEIADPRLVRILRNLRRSRELWVA